MDVLPKTFLQINLAANWLLRYSRMYVRPNQQRRPLPSLLYLSFFTRLEHADATVYIWFLGNIYENNAGHIPLHPLKPWHARFYALIHKKNIRLIWNNKIEWIFYTIFVTCQCYKITWTCTGRAKGPLCPFKLCPTLLFSSTTLLSLLSIICYYWTPQKTFPNLESLSLKVFIL